mmetsp:Transcript_2908/g.4363  ORF Transcript_2908/g.4363 Transcript_2908/m.4363 type:complete len:86 (+) Transcript_2908:313-570(+)
MSIMQKRIGNYASSIKSHVINYSKPGQLYEVVFYSFYSLGLHNMDDMNEANTIQILESQITYYTNRNPITNTFTIFRCTTIPDMT